jgi:hypothetical protein
VPIAETSNQCSSSRHLVRPSTGTSGFNDSIGVSRVVKGCSGGQASVPPAGRLASLERRVGRMRLPLGGARARAIGEKRKPRSAALGSPRLTADWWYVVDRSCCQRCRATSDRYRTASPANGGVNWVMKPVETGGPRVRAPVAGLNHSTRRVSVVPERSTVNVSPVGA